MVAALQPAGTFRAATNIHNGLPGSPPTRDIGNTDLYWGTFGQGLLTDWWETTADLIWPQSVITYGRMRQDTQIRAVLYSYLLPILRAQWWLDPEGCSDEVAQHCADDLGLPILGDDPHPGPARRRGINWRRHLRDAAYHRLVYGHMPFELRYRIDRPEPGGVHLDHLGARMPWTLAQIMLNPDSTINHIVQTTQIEPIPANRLVWYVHQQEGANWAGISMLRPAFGAWLLKHETQRVHATAIRRFGMGVPTVEAPAGGSANQVAQAQQLASAMRVGDQSGVGLPQGYAFKLAGLTGTVPDALAFLKYLDASIAKMALAGLIELGQSEHGSRALGESFLDLFLLSLQAEADDLADTATSGQDGMPGIVTDLVDQNWGEDEPAPRIVCGDIGSNYEVTAEALWRLTQAGALVPDPALDRWIRDTWKLPERETPWEPMSRGIPAPGEPAGPVPGTGQGLPAPAPLVQPAPAPGTAKPPGPAGPPAPGTKQAATRRGRGARTGRRGRALAAAPPGQFHRQLTPREVAAGFDPAGHQQEWLLAREALVVAYRPVVSAQRAELVEQVVAAVEAGQMGKLGSLSVPTSDGQSVIYAAMKQTADLGALRVATEAAHQGVTIPMDQVTIQVARLQKVASARAQLIAARLAQAAGVRVLQQVRAASPPAQHPEPKTPAQQAVDAADDLAGWLALLSENPVADQLGAALTAAQNMGRMAAFLAGPANATYLASEIEDDNTCKPCQDEDGLEFTSLAEAQDAYPNGGYLFCEGGMRCRGTVVGFWGGGG